MRRAGRIVDLVLRTLIDACRPAVTTDELEQIGGRIIKQEGGEPLFLDHAAGGDVPPYPAPVCISVNEEVVHGIPGDRCLHSGDLVSVDCGVRVRDEYGRGWCADAAISIVIGRGRPEIDRLRNRTRELLALAIELIRPGIRWSTIARILETEARRTGYGVVAGFVGHGIGRALHEMPQVPCFCTPDFERYHDFSLENGMTIAIEPMLTLGAAETHVLDDGWTVVTRDGLPAAHEEHTIAVTQHGADILTDGR